MRVYLHRAVKNDLPLGKRSPQPIGHGVDLAAVHVYHFPKIVLFGGMGKILSKLKVIDAVKAFDLNLALDRLQCERHKYLSAEEMINNS